MCAYKYKKKGKTDEHRVIMEGFLGRKLSRNEVVHHKNGDGKDNRIENLAVMSRAEHTALHIKQGDIVPTNIKALGVVPPNRSPITKTQAQCIYDLATEGVVYSRIGEMFGVSDDVVWSIANGRSFVNDVNMHSGIVSRNKRTLLSTRSAQHIYDLSINGVSAKDISALFSIPEYTVRNIVYGKSFKNSVVRQH